VVLVGAPGLNPLPISESDAQEALQKIAREHLAGKVRYKIYTQGGGEPPNAILKAVEELGVDSGLWRLTAERA
jgi:hypothetical protein